MFLHLVQYLSVTQNALLRVHIETLARGRKDHSSVWYSGSYVNSAGSGEVSIVQLVSLWL